MGNQNGINDEKYITHKKYYKETKRISDVLLIENVPEYQSATASAELGPQWSSESVVLDPRLFGVPASRPRRFILAFDKRKVRRVEGVSLGSTSHSLKHIRFRFCSQIIGMQTVSKLHPRTLTDILEALIAQTVSTADMFLWMECSPSTLSPAQVSWHQHAYYPIFLIHWLSNDMMSMCGICMWIKKLIFILLMVFQYPVLHALRKDFLMTMMSTSPICASQTFPNTLGMAGVEGNALTRAFVPSPLRQNSFPRTVNGLGSKGSVWNNLTRILLQWIHS